MSIVRVSEVQTRERFSGVKGRVLLNQDRGAGAVTLGELVMEPGSLLPPHTHLVEEAFYIFEGSGTAIVGDKEHPVEAGTAILAPAGVPHGFKNPTAAPLKMVFMYPAVNPRDFFPQ